MDILTLNDLSSVLVICKHEHSYVNKSTYSLSSYKISRHKSFGKYWNRQNVVWKVLQVFMAWNYKWIWAASYAQFLYSHLGPHWKMLKKIRVNWLVLFNNEKWLIILFMVNYPKTKKNRQIGKCVTIVI